MGNDVMTVLNQRNHETTARILRTSVQYTCFWFYLDKAGPLSLLCQIQKQILDVQQHTT